MAASGEPSAEAAFYTENDYAVWENYPYGDLDGQTFNAKFREQSGSLPVLIAVPGGAFRFVDNGHLNNIYDYWVENGYLVVQLNYTTGADTYPQAVEDVRSGIQYVVDNADVLHADTDDITVLGCSAGAYLAARAAFDSEGCDYSVKNFVDFFGATQWMTEGFLPGVDSPEASWIGSDIAAMAEELDPLTYLDEGDVVRVWISHGTGDTTMDIGQSEQFFEGCAAVLGEENVHFEPIEGANHEGAEFYTAENFALVDEYISQ